MTLKVGIIGTNGHIRYVLDGIPEIEDCQLIGCCPEAEGKNVTKVTRHEAWSDNARVFDTPLDLLEEGKPDVVSVAMMFPENSKYSRMALERGVSVVSEKPLATELEDLDLLRKTAEHSQGRITAMYAYRFWPDYEAARNIRLTGSIGKVCQVSAQKSYQWGDRNDWYKQRETYGGTIPWVAIHAIDFMRWTSGEDFTSVQGMQANLVRKDFPGCEDCGALLFGLTGGGQGILTFDYLRPAAADSHGDDRLRIVGSTGIIELQSARGIAEVTTDEEPVKKLEIPPETNMFVDFVKELRGGEPSRISQDEAFRSCEISLLARKACEEGAVVKIPQPA
ncbi:MAG: Gfo/Idh/MocA family oxidoreductase [Candidatus Omnitrophica bacterium]|nr:Gfo/Idh/MocA family oxidoreductase [Candidatus Omnitrophota bacterium]MCB9768301.1 Gfo/Idh/MocA family oxidoreductase [Candidatus Omnitrophota bacterium]